MASPLSTAAVSFRGVQKELVLYPGISTDEFKAVAQSAFNITADIVGLKGGQYLVHLPLSLVCSDPSIVSK
jgi:hypothetical protein